VAGVDTDADEVVVFGFPIVVAFVTVDEPPDTTVVVLFVIPVLLLTVFTMVVLLGAEAIRPLPSGCIGGCSGPALIG
jgi:hypothetical protein